MRERMPLLRIYGKSKLFLHFQSAPTPRGTSTSTGSSSRRTTLPLRLARSASAT